MAKPVIAEYIWIDADLKLRSKCQTLYLYLDNIIDLKQFHNCDYYTKKSLLQYFPNWNFDGSSTRQNTYDSTGINTEVILKPVNYYQDPFNNFKSVLKLLILCECLSPDLKPIKSNTRHIAVQTFNNSKISIAKPWYGLEQEYVLYRLDTNQPIGWLPIMESEDYNSDQFYCGIGSLNISGRDIVEEHYDLCLSIGLKISGINSEVMPGQWEFQVGPCLGIEAADTLWIARYVLERLCEKHKLYVNYHPKPKNRFNGSGCHVNFSTKSMRDDNGFSHITNAVKRLETNHHFMMKYYGNNNKRLTGKHETSDPEIFSWGIGTRNTSVRIPNHVKLNNKGYFEDRRPASDIDPYIVTSLIAKTVIL